VSNRFGVGRAVTGRSLADSGRNIWRASVGAGNDTRQLYVNGTSATRARHRQSVRLTFTNAGLTFSNPALDYLNSLANQNRVELETVNSFSDRCSPVQSVGAMSSRCSSLRGTTTLGGTTGWPRRADVELPTSDSLVDIGGTYHAPAHHISFSGITFSGTSWRGPGSTWLLGGHAGVTDPAVNALGLRAFDQLPHHLRPPDLAQSDEATEPAVEHAHLRPSSHVVARLGISRAATTATPDPITGRHEKNR
jgi:hypothetical protein